MPRKNPFTVTIYSKGLAFQQTLGSAISYSFTPRWTLGTGEIITRATDPANSLLGQKGARFVALYRGEVLMSGFVQQQQGSVLKTGTKTWNLYDDRYVLSFTRAWVRPGGNLAATSLSDPAQQVPAAAGHADGLADGSGYYAWPAAVTAAETAVKRVIADNLARFGSNVAQGKIAVQPDQGRGGDARAAGKLPQLRFDPLHDGLLDLLEWANLGLRVWQDGSSLKLDVWQPKTWTQTIGTAAKIVTDGTYQVSIPTLTRLVIGGPGEDAARVFAAAADSTGLEDAYGIAVEGFIDATGATLHWPNGLDESLQVAAYYLQRGDVTDTDKQALRTYLVQAASAALAAGLPTAGLDISLSETDSFHYGGPDGYHVGDRITVQIDGGPSITQRITETTLTYTTDGLSVTPKVGEISNDATEQLATAVAGIATTVGRLSTRT